MKLNAFALCCGALFALAVTSARASEAGAPSAGPVIEQFGPVYDVDSPDFVTPTNMTYRAVFDVAQSPEVADQINPRIESLARFLNMQARAGAKPEQVKLALVVHGAASKDMLSNAAYKARLGVDNPNAPLLAALQSRGVQVILCGQTAAYRGFSRQELAPGVEIALSAMTALVVLQSEGYQLIAF